MSREQVENFFKKAWLSYTKVTPDAEKIHSLLEKRGETIVNDHVAYRTFQAPGVNRFEVGKVFEKMGYKMNPEVLDFPEKKLKANYWAHPERGLPKVFISELLLDECSSELQNWIGGLLKQFEKKWGKVCEESLLGDSWDPVRFEDYQKFYPESEYAAWTAAFGIRLNHFTVFVNELESFESLQDLNQFLLQNDFQLNSQGGVIKGTPSTFLEQSSTVAKKVHHRFSDFHEPKEVLGCYYEFARRYPLPDGSGKLFHGFIPKSADKIFESNFERS